MLKHAPSGIYGMISTFVLRLIIIVIFLFSSLSLSAQLIGTVAGNGYDGTTGEGGPAICAGIPFPSGVCVTPGNDIYITSSNAVRKVNANSGFITTIAGSNAYGYSGDGGFAINATMQSPKSICLDPAGNLYVAEYSGNRIRKINAVSHIISTVAGTGTAGYSGDEGPAVNASLNTPQGINTDDSGNLYIADTYNSRVRKINFATGIITTIAGIGSPSFSGDGGLAIKAGVAYPVSVCVDAMGNVYIAEVFSGITSRIRKINATTGVITTIAGNGIYAYGGDGGPATNASLFNPASVCVDPIGTVYITEYDDSRIRKISATTGIITTFAGNGINGFSGDRGLAVNAALHSPVALCADNSGNLFVADNANHRIRKIYVNLTSPPPPSPDPTINISSSPASICLGNPVTFTAEVLNGGTNAHYQWKKNGINVGPNYYIYEPDTLNNGDIISCAMTSISCNGITTTVTSNSITVAIKPTATPSVTISASATSVCTGGTIIFTATPLNSGSNPSFQWKLNGNNVGTDSATWSASALTNGDVVNCVLTADTSFTCVTTRTAISSNIVMNVTSALAPSVSIRVSDNNICPGTLATFTAIPQNAGPLPSYQWKLNEVNVGNNSPTYVNNNLVNNDHIYCTVTSDNSCSSVPVSSGLVTMIVKNIPVINIYPEDTTVSAGSQVQLNASVIGTIASYQWMPATNLINPLSLSPLTQPIINNTDYIFSILSIDSCTTSKKITIKIFRKLYMPNAFTPNGDGRNDVFRIPADVSLNLKEFSIYDRWGNKIFSTTDINKGWDGYVKGAQANSGVYMYFISGLDGSNKIFLKGTVVLIR